MSKLFIVFISLFIVHSTCAQSELTWDDFADVHFDEEYNEKYEVYFLLPTFGDMIKSYQGKEISIKGYFLDIAGNGEVLLVSQYPMASCFFCGTVGPETIVEVSFKEKPSFRTDQVVTVTGILELNREDVDHCIYVLKEAEGKLIN